MILKKVFFPVFLCFGIITAIQAGNFNSLYRVGLRKLSARDYDGALAQFKSAYSCAELSQEEIKILLIIADVYSRKKKYKDARNWAIRVLDIPDLKLKSKISTYRRLISYSIYLKRYDDALDDVRTALRNVSSNNDKVVFLIERARIFELQKKYQQAGETLQECIKICEVNSRQWQSVQQKFIAVLFKQKKYQQILTLVNELEMDKWQAYTKHYIYYYAGLCAMRQKKCKLATSWFERMPDSGRSWLVYSKNSQLGSCWRKLKEYDKAYKCFEVIYKNSKLQNYYRANGLYMMADMRYLQKKYNDSKVLCEKLKKFPEVSEKQIKRANRLLKRMKK